MSESRLSQRLSLCQSIERMNDAGCLEVIRVFYQLDCKTINQFVSGLAIQITETMSYNSLKNLNNSIKQIISNNNFTKKESDHDQSTHDRDTIAECSLFRLPIDIIANTSLFLNKSDIYSFEQCCRLFYQMINNSSYLKQTNNFKTFTIDNKRLNQSVKSMYGCYKYCHAKKLIITSTLQWVNLVADIYKRWEQAQNCIYFNYWYKDLFNSIVSLIFDGGFLVFVINKLPLEILFDSQSLLQKVTFVHDLIQFEDILVEFDQRYLDLKKELEKHGKNIKKLDKIEHYQRYATMPITGPRYLETRHLSLISQRNELPMSDVLSKINVLTCKDSFNISQLKQLKVKPADCKIVTLRLIDFLQYPHICLNKDLIESLNLHHSLINLTMELKNGIQFDWFEQTIDKVLTKEYYHHLKNVNLLFSLFSFSDPFRGIKTFETKKYIKKIFQILRKHCKVLKHQFIQLNIAIKKKHKLDKLYAFESIEWNSEIDEKFLNEKEKEMQYQISKSANKENELKYSQWKEQWV